MVNYEKKQIIEHIYNRLYENKEVLMESFMSNSDGTSTKYCILDGLLPEDLTRETYKNFPQDDVWFYRDTFRERKLTFAKLTELSSPLPEMVTDAFHDQKILNIVGKIVKIDDLRADKTLYAGGLSKMNRSHFLNPHIDNSHNAVRSSYRRLNLLFYVTPDIDENDGGNFELWDSNVKKPLKIPSKFNRLVIMETTPTSWHSVDPVKSDISRCCVSNYYFTKESPLKKDYYHVTSFTGRPDQTWQRLYGSVDNYMRQKVATFFKVSRGRKLGRN
jgi:Rps23 Pro-64 3,4-dihydroxylase Tpa1-like proline 4-hydroxylase